MPLALSSFRFLLILLLCQGVWAHQPEEGKVMLTMGPYLHQTYVPLHYDVHLPASLGFGLLVEGDINRKGGLEMGLFYMKKSYFQDFHGTPIVERVGRVHIPVGYRYWWSPRFSGSLGFYSSYSIGDPRPLDTISHQAGFDSAARRPTKYGFDVSMLWDVIDFGDSIVVLDARLSLALAPKSGEHSSHFGLMCGLKFKL